MLECTPPSRRSSPFVTQSACRPHPAPYPHTQTRMHARTHACVQTRTHARTPTSTHTCASMHLCCTTLDGIYLEGKRGVHPCSLFCRWTELNLADHSTESNFLPAHHSIAVIFLKSHRLAISTQRRLPPSTQHVRSQIEMPLSEQLTSNTLTPNNVTPLCVSWGRTAKCAQRLQKQTATEKETPGLLCM